ncbi:transcriptional regulator [Modestobacter sp. I12A-02628]|uniref:Transcriptional regulator n=1 Tax=Goekera deserti TaxID=2497753 RepID=A0A7K3WAG8_9ACTN|nr:transcriptional regulator [Goekera deserti]NDI47644.1 transcriptional regulator [Goekera deserti]NDI47707.1 transcriptional regulator [Goekera deserti]NEL53455.1 transcriptional regulator [Goekera deserti]
MGLLVLLLAALPSLVGRLPAADADRSAADLRAAVLASGDVAFSGYAQSAGGLTLPLTDTFTGIADLFSDRATMRTWYRSAQDWRTDVVTATGETGTHRDATGTWTWQYEDDEATRARVFPLSLPIAPDLLPSDLGRRLLSQAADDELTRTGAERIAGRDALGLRLVPADVASSVSHVDLWVDAATGVTLRVEVFGGDASAVGVVTGEPALSTGFLDVDFTEPAASVTAFTPPPGADVETDEGLPVLDGGRTPDQSPLPAELAGLPRQDVEGVERSVGVYGRGITQLVVVPIPGRFADRLRGQLDVAPGAVLDDLGVRLSAGPLGLMIATGPRGATYLLAGTVTSETLASVAGQLPTTGGRG